MTKLNAIQTGTMIRTISGVFVIVLLISLFVAVSIWAGDSKKQTPVEKLSNQTQDVIVDAYNATGYSAENYRWENNCFYFSLTIGTWQDTHREVYCGKFMPSSAELDTLVTNNIEWTLSQVSAPSPASNVIVDYYVPDKSEEFVTDKALALKQKRIQEELDANKPKPVDPELAIEE